MNQRIQLLVRQLNIKHLDAQIALQCAPVLFGIKISNILFVDNVHKNTVKCMFHNTVLSYYQLYSNKEQVSFLIFYPKPLLHYLSQTEVYKLMEEFGYRNENLRLILKEVKSRYQHYMETNKNFPHELGLLLGYPSWDVRGFIQHKGENYLLSGYWKIYGNVENAKRIFERYEKAKELLLTWVIGGGKIQSVLSFRHENGKKYRNYRKVILTNSKYAI